MMKPIPILIAFLCLVHWATSADKYAVIVGISEYAPGTGWNKLSADEDIRLMSGTLRGQGFDSSNILILRNSSATKTAILDAIHVWLFNKVKPGDMAVFHFSGHGQQIFDDNDDETDLFDEALVPYNASSKFRAGDNNHLRDDELGQALEDIRKKLGKSGHMLVMLDACHSGTGIRSMANHRGTTDKIISDKDLYKKLNETLEGKKSSEQRESSFGLIKNSSFLSPVVCFFASSADELNYEAYQNGKRSGSLTLAFVRSLAKMSPQKSYRSLFESIQREMSVIAPAQNPKTEGTLDLGIFNGIPLKNVTYYNVIGNISSNQVTISFGTLMGSAVGSRVKFYASDTRDTTGLKPIANGTIIKANDFTSIVQLPGSISEAVRFSWIYPENINYGEIRTRVSLGSDTLLNRFKKILSELSTVEIVDGDKAEVDIGYLKRDNVILFLDNAKNIFRFIEYSADDPTLKKEVGIVISDFARANFLRTLKLSNDQLDARVDLIYDNEKSHVDSSHFVTLRESDTIRFRFSGKQLIKRAYFTLLDIQPDHHVRVVFPLDDQTPEECFLDPGEVKEPGSSFLIGPPFGKEIFQLIVSEHPIDLRQYFDRTVSKSMNPKHAFEKLIKNASSIQYSKTKGIKLGSGSPGAVNIFSLLVNIVPYKDNP